MSGPFSALEVCAVYTSPLLRAIQTAEEICRLNKIGIRIAPELSEYNMGIYEGTACLIPQERSRTRRVKGGDLNKTTSMPGHRAGKACAT
jgi:Histidine phosphatase superfamily (branch 1)